MGDLSSTVLGFATGTYSVTRAAYRANPYGTDGKLIAPSTTTVSARACVQPATGRDLQRLPEGLRARDVVALWSVDELLTARPGQEPDIVTIDGASWQVEHVERWDQLGSYWRAVLVKTGR